MLEEPVSTSKDPSSQYDALGQAWVRLHGHATTCLQYCAGAALRRAPGGGRQGRAAQPGGDAAAPQQPGGAGRRWRCAGGRPAPGAPPHEHCSMPHVLAGRASSLVQMDMQRYVCAHLMHSQGPSWRKALQSHLQRERLLRQHRRFMSAALVDRMNMFVFTAAHKLLWGRVCIDCCHVGAHRPRGCALGREC